MDLQNLRIVLVLGALALATLGVLILVAIRRTERATGFSVNGGSSGMTVAASDTGTAPGLLLREPSLGLRGRPDYIVEGGAPNDRLLYPLEVKPSRRSNRLYESDRLQLGAYLVAMRKTVGSRAGSSGYVRYATGTFRIDLTPELERRVRETVALVRKGRQSRVLHRSHSIRARCVACPVRAHCDERLG